MSIAIIVHGGAGIIAPERADITQAGCKEAAALGWQVLQNKNSLTDTFFYQGLELR